MSDPKRFAGARPYFHAAVAGTVLDIATGSGLSLFEIDAKNNNAAAAFLQFFFKAASAVTLGSTIPDYVVPMTSSEIARRSFSNGLSAAQATGLSVACTTTSNGSGAGSADLSAGYF